MALKRRISFGKLYPTHPCTCTFYWSILSIEMMLYAFFMPISTTNKTQTNRSFPELGYCIQKNTVHRPWTISLSGLLTKKIPVWQRECWVGVTVHSRGALLNSKTAPCGTFFDSTYYLCHALSSALWALWLTWTPSNLCSADADIVLQKSNLEACTILYLKSSCVLTFIQLFTCYWYWYWPTSL